MKRILENTASLYVLQAANYILPIITVPYLLRILGAEGFGLVAFSQAFTAYFVVVTEYGFNMSATRRIAMIRDDHNEVIRTFNAVMATKFLLLAVSTVLAIAVVAAVPQFRSQWPVYAASYLAVVGATLFPVWFFQGMERMKFVTGVHVAARIATTIAIFFFVRERGDYVLAALIQASGGLVGGAVALALVPAVAPMPIRLPGFAAVQEQLRDGRHLFLSTSAVTLYTNTNIVLLGLLVGNAAVGYFSAAEKLVKAAQSALSPVNQAIYPHVSATAARSRQLALDFLTRVLWWMGASTLLASIALFALSGVVVPMLYGPGFEITIQALRWMSPLPFVVALGNIFGVQTMLTFGMQRDFSRIVLGAGVLNIILLALLAPSFGAPGAAFSVLMTECVVTGLFAVAVHRSGIRFGRFPALRVAA